MASREQQAPALRLQAPGWRDSPGAGEAGRGGGMQTGSSAAEKLEDLSISVASHGLSEDRSQTCSPSASRHIPAGPNGAGVRRSKCWAGSVAGLVGLELVRSRDVK